MFPMIKNLIFKYFFKLAEETEEDDNQLLLELQQDPIFKEDMEKNLTKFLQNFSGNENFGSFIDQLTDNEKKILQNLQTVQA